MKKYLIPLLLITSFTSTTAYAAGFFSKLADYTFFSDRKSGVFVGIDQNQDVTTSYKAKYNTVKTSQNSGTLTNTFDKTLSDPRDTLTYGLRFYIPMKDKKSILNNFGAGFKGWYSSQTHNLDELYLTETKIETIGYEGQLYYDFLNFSTKKINHSIGLTVGMGTETKTYSNFSTTTAFGSTSSTAFNKFTNINSNFELESLVYDISLHYTLANRVRVEFGYKMTEFGSNKQRDSRFVYTGGSTGYTAVAETTVVPSNNYYYIAYSLQF